jgi:putative PEP-CTERM system histidine kinase
MSSWWTVLPAASTIWALALAAVVLSRGVRNPVHQSFASGMLALSIMECGHLMVVLRPDAASSWTQVAFAGQIFLPLPWLVFSLTFGRAKPVEHLRRWRLVLGAVGAISLGFLGLLVTGRFMSDDFILQGAGFGFSIFLLLSLTAVGANIEQTVRSADRSHQWRMKYFLLGLFTIIALAIFDLSQVILYASAEQWIAPLFSTAVLIGCALMTFALVRHRLFDVDVFLSRYVVYNSLTVVLVGAYLLGVGVVAQAVKSFGGDSSAYWGALVVVVGLLALAAVLLSYDARTRVKIFVNRHFFKYKYDYRKEWLDLTERLSSKPTAESIVPALAAMFFETFWIRDTFLWLSDERERTLAPTPPRPAAGIPYWSSSVLAALKTRDYPVLTDARPNARNAAPTDGLPVDALNKLGVRILVPLVAQGRLVGVLGLAAPHTASPLTEEDFDLLKTIGKQVANSLLNAELLRQLVASKELETFHSLSTFLLHDLKNFVSMLSLLVDNMGRNFDNPAFRQDALKNLSQTVEKMKQLMDRLRALAQQPQPALEPVDLSRLGRSVLEEMASSLKAKIVADWKEVPPVRADPAQMRQVLINLVLNAEEAVDGGGEIRVSTQADHGMVTCIVADNGRGIPPEFLHTRLFKPFATTKSGGFGVGLFQCKMIIEAHGGRVSADSRVGEGSTLSFSLPAIGAST